jgi:hypothetical protein
MLYQENLATLVAGGFQEGALVVSFYGYFMYMAKSLNRNAHWEITSTKPGPILKIFSPKNWRKNLLF